MRKESVYDDDYENSYEHQEEEATVKRRMADGIITDTGCMLSIPLFILKLITLIAIL